MIAAVVATACGRFGYEDQPGAPLSRDELAAAADCEPLTAARGAVIDVAPDDAADLPEIVAAAAPGTTVRLASGTYNLTGSIAIGADGIVLRSASGDPADVVIDGTALPIPIAVSASDVAIAELTIAGGQDESLHIGGAGAIVYRIAVRDPSHVGIGLGTVASTSELADGGVVACSTVAISTAARAALPAGCSGLSGIRASGIRGWTIRNSRFAGFHCAPSANGFGLHISEGSRDIVIERNRIDDAWFGMRLGFEPVEVPGVRTYSDDPCPGAYADFIGGVVRNNFITVGDAVIRADAGIGLWAACGTRIVHNTLLSTRTETPFSSIEWRYPETREVEITNNLMNYAMLERQGATVVAAGNIETAELPALVVDPGAGDLHLIESPGNPALDTGAAVEPGTCDDDADGEPRSATPDVGADEL